MSSSKKREQTLHRLLEDNFLVARHCRKSSEAISDTSLRYYYQNNASRRSQFAMEIAGEITFYTGTEPYTPSQAFDRSRNEIGKGSTLDIVKISLKLAKKSLENYDEALCCIHDGSCREILLRHRTFIENSIFELKSIKKLIKFQNKTNARVKAERSHTG